MCARLPRLHSMSPPSDQRHEKRVAHTCAGSLDPPPPPPPQSSPLRAPRAHTLPVTLTPGSLAWSSMGTRHSSGPAVTKLCGGQGPRPPRPSGVDAQLCPACRLAPASLAASPGLLPRTGRRSCVCHTMGSGQGAALTAQKTVATEPCLSPGQRLSPTTSPAQQAPAQCLSRRGLSSRRQVTAGCRGDLRP